MITCTQLSRHCASNLDSADHTLSKFSAYLKEDPLYAFQWGESAVTACASRELNRQIAAWLDRDTELDDDTVIRNITTYIADQLSFRACNPSSSTSAMSNLVETARTTAVAKMFSYLTKGF